MAYFEEKLIDGKLCYRENPTDAWTRYTLKTLTVRYQNLKKATYGN